MAATQRYWDGEKWTDQIAPAGPTVVRVETGRKPLIPNPGRLALKAAGVIVALFAAMAIASAFAGRGSTFEKALGYVWTLLLIFAVIPAVVVLVASVVAKIVQVIVRGGK